MALQESKGDKVFNIINVTLQIILLGSILYPFMYLISVSISDPSLVARGKIWLLPKNISFETYKYVFDFDYFWRGYLNTIYYTAFGTAWGVFLTVITAYPLSRKNLGGRKFFMMILLITMYFQGGMIPTYLLISKLGLIDKRAVLIIPGAIAAWYVIMTRSFFESLPEALIESAKIDGASNIGIFIRIILPLSKAIIAVMVLFIAVERWNTYFSAIIYLNDAKLQPVQVVLQKILINFQDNEIMGQIQGDKRGKLSQGVRYALIIVTILPILCVYPFIQKYFVKGVMIGAVKG